MHTTGLCTHVSHASSVPSLEEKFIVHSMEQKAHHLRRLTEVFLSGCLEDSYPRSDAHYGTLSFLLCLSESPIHASYQPSLLNLSGAESEVEWFDWTSYLIEGIEYESSESDSSEVCVCCEMSLYHIHTGTLSCACCV